MLVVAALFYVFLWALARNGATSLVAPLLIPVVLAVLVALGVALNRYLGLPPRRLHFDDRDRGRDRDHEPEQ